MLLTVFIVSEVELNNSLIAQTKCELACQVFSYEISKTQYSWKVMFRELLCCALLSCNSKTTICSQESDTLFFLPIYCQSSYTLSEKLA